MSTLFGSILITFSFYSLDFFFPFVLKEFPFKILRLLLQIFLIARVTDKLLGSYSVMAPSDPALLPFILLFSSHAYHLPTFEEPLSEPPNLI
jgi:hypothetical protein